MPDTWTEKELRRRMQGMTKHTSCFDMDQIVPFILDVIKEVKNKTIKEQKNER